MGKFLHGLGGRKRGRRGKGDSKLKWTDYDENYEEDDYEDDDYEDDDYEDEEFEDEYAEYEEDYEDEDAELEGYEDEEDYEDEDYETDDEDSDEEEYYGEDEYEIEGESEGYEDYEDEEDYDGEDYEIEDEAEGYEREEDYGEEGYDLEAEDYDEEDYEIKDEDYDEEDYETEDEDDGYEDDDYGEEDDELGYDEDYDDEDYDYEDDEIPEGVAAKVIYRLKNMSMVDHIVALTGVAVLIVVVITGTLFLNAKNNQSQIEAFAEIGVGMEDISMIGKSGLIAVSDAQTAKYLAATMEMETSNEDGMEEKDENDKPEGKIEVSMNLTSIQKDLKIKFINKKTGKLIPNLNFKVEITKPSGGTYTAEDDDKDGIIYQTGIEAGKYKVKIVGPDSDSTYSISSEQMSVTVKDTIEYKKVDVADEVKTESQVNAAAEDTKVNETVVESTNTDTVEWVESTKTLIEGTETKEESYEKVETKEIADPGKVASIGFRLLTAENEVTPTTEPTSEPTPEPTQAPTEEPTAEPTQEPTEEPTQKPTEEPKPTQAPPTAEPTATPTIAPTATPQITPSPTPTAVPTVAPTASPTASPSVSPTASPSATATPNNAKNDTTSILKTTKGETLYIKNSDGSYREAKYADYYTSKEFYRLVSKTSGQYKYTGWQVIDGATYFFDKNGNKVTGEQVIQGAKYNFNSDGSLNTGSGHMGIDVSKWNGNIDWNAVKNSGVSYVIIRCGYRGSSTGALIEDPMFRSNIQGASKAGLKVGVYFFTQAVNEVEAVEEASMVLGLIKGYGLSYPVFLDVEASNGRADGISTAARTAVCKAFCQTIQNSGYKAGVYANKTWLNSHIDAPSLASYKIWLAQYAAAPSYNRTKYDMWQYSSKGSVTGIKGNVDMNISYMGY